MNKFTFILGGARSGKSAYAVELAKKSAKRAAFIATAACLDSEMKERIKKHKASRPGHWKLIEEEKDISPVLAKLNDKYEAVIIDCMGLLVSNLLAHNLKNKEIEKSVQSIISAIRKCKPAVILVSNETGMGMVPDNALARRFRDLIGLANQMAAKEADEVIFMQAGIPIYLKGQKRT